MSERSRPVADDKKKVYETTFKADAYLMYLLQTSTGLPTAKLLGFFSDLGKQVAKVGWDFMDKKNTRGMRKEIHDFFPGTSIPFMLFVKGYRWRSSEPATKYTADIIVGFPEKATFVKQQELDTIIMENLLLGGCDMAPFERPEPKTPKLYKELMKEIRNKRIGDTNEQS